DVLLHVVTRKWGAWVAGIGSAITTRLPSAHCLDVVVGLSFGHRRTWRGAGPYIQSHRLLKQCATRVPGLHFHEVRASCHRDGRVELVGTDAVFAYAIHVDG